MSRIEIVLPSREGFGPSHFGAIALCVRDFTRHSRYREQCRIFGAVDTPPFEGLHFQPVPIKRRFFQSRNRLYAKALLKEFARSQPEVLEIHNRPILLRHFATRWPGKLVLHLHNDPQSMRYARTAPERKTLLDQAVAIYCVSDYIRQRFLEGIDDPLQKVQVVYNGLALTPPPQEKQNHILFVGRFQPEKGALEIAQALQQILPEFPDWKGIFIGAARHEPNAQVNEYEREVINALKPVESQIEMRGFCHHDETMAATAEAAIAVIPSQWNEAFGRTALEAMAKGCATISSARGGLNEVIGEGAYRLDTVSADTIATALRELIPHPEKRRALQHAGLQRARYFEIQQVTNTLDKIRETLLR